MKEFIKANYGVLTIFLITWIAVMHLLISANNKEVENKLELKLKEDYCNELQIRYKITTRFFRFEKYDYWNPSCYVLLKGRYIFAEDYVESLIYK